MQDDARECDKTGVPLMTFSLHIENFPLVKKKKYHNGKTRFKSKHICLMEFEIEKGKKP